MWGSEALGFESSNGLSQSKGNGNAPLRDRTIDSAAAATKKPVMKIRCDAIAARTQSAKNADGDAPPNVGESDGERMATHEVSLKSANGKSR
ncbi:MULTISPECIES: hypothetical protein [unclassified Burkholderia]|uniref:hypothetical protein n=1 Tax=unclassified Burkholderia TaxID=2613784 RepID=UPI0012E36289|nr:MULTISPECIES: hypothetical protein [unclassified Burkholderia]